MSLLHVCSWSLLQLSQFQLHANIILVHFLSAYLFLTSPVFACMHSLPDSTFSIFFLLLFSGACSELLQGYRGSNGKKLISLLYVLFSACIVFYSNFCFNDVFELTMEVTNLHIIIFSVFISRITAFISLKTTLG